MPTATDVLEAKREKVRRLAGHDSVAWCRAYRPHIRLQRGEYVPFEPFGFQEDYLRALDAGGPVIVNKSRQIGLSTATMIHAAYDAVEHDGWLALVISRKEKVAKELVRMARDALVRNECSALLKMVRNNETELELSNGSRIVAETASEDAGRVFAASRLIFDEFAFLPWAEEMWRAARPTIEATGNVVILSTPNGEGDEFCRQWRAQADAVRASEVGDVSRGDTRYRAFRLPWWVHPRRDEAWKQAELEDTTLRDFKQEYECDFLASGENVFPTEAVQAALALWPQVAGREVSRRTIGVDVAGEGRDETVITDLDASAEPFVVLGQDAWEHIPAPELQRQIAERQKPDAEVAIDYTGVGYGVAQNLDCPHRKITFTGGATVTGDERHERVPRNVLLSTAVNAMEHGRLALNPEHRELLRAIQTARWEKKQGDFVDRLDSWLLAVWMANRRTEITIDVW